MRAPTTTRKARIELTAGQKAARTKRLAGLDLSAIARKALRTRRRNAKAAEQAKAERATARAARKAAQAPAPKAARKAA